MGLMRGWSIVDPKWDEPKLPEGEIESWSIVEPKWIEMNEVIHRNPDKSLKQTERLMEAMKEFGAEIVLRNVSKTLKLDPQYVLEYYRKNVKKS
mgnify:CR=1 FL=1